MSSITVRMEVAIGELERRTGGRRYPKAFYLVPDDWVGFIATDPPSGRFPWGNNPTVWRDDPTFHNVPVRETNGKLSRLYDNTGAGRKIT